jgi:hypothetical protein
VKITLPPPEQKLLCHNIYLVFDEDFENMHYVTVELDSVAKKKRVSFIGEWDIDHNHYNYGQAPNGVSEQERMIEKLFC